MTFSFPPSPEWTSLDPIYQPIKLGGHTVPGVWAYMFPEEVRYFRVDPEVKSSCFNCPQVKDAGFHPSVRCCTVIPRIPNFLLGMALQGEPTKTLVESYIAGGFVLPEGSNISPAQLVTSLAYIVKPTRDTPTVVCPFLDWSSKQCKMYAFRSTVCSTFFCHHDRGEAGRIFWEDLQDLGSQIETALSQWALAEVGFDVAGYFKRFDTLSIASVSLTDAGASNWSLNSRQILWGEWFGREAELYRACADVIIQNKNDLYAIASRQSILQTIDYDHVLRTELEKTFPKHLVAEALPEGQPEKIENLRYSTQLSQRNLQMSRMPGVAE